MERVSNYIDDNLDCLMVLRKKSLDLHAKMHHHGNTHVHKLDNFKTNVTVIGEALQDKCVFEKKLLKKKLMDHCEKRLLKKFTQ